MGAVDIGVLMMMICGSAASRRRILADAVPRAVISVTISGGSALLSTPRALDIENLAGMGGPPELACEPVGGAAAESPSTMKAPTWRGSRS